MYKDYAEMMDDMMADFAMTYENECSDYEDSVYEDESDFDYYDDYDECGFNPYMGTYDYDC